MLSPSLSVNRAVNPAVSLGQHTSPARGVLGVAAPSSDDALDVPAASLGVTMPNFTLKPFAD